MIRSMFNELAEQRRWSPWEQVTKLFDFIVEEDFEDGLDSYFDDDSDGDRSDEPRSPIKFVIAGYDSEDNPKFAHVIVEANEYDIENRADLGAASGHAEDDADMHECTVFCERHSAFIQLMPLFDWASADIVSAENF